MVLEILYSRIGRFITRNGFMIMLYEASADPPQDRIIDVYICHARRLLTGSQWKIETQRGLGWRLIARSDDDNGG